MRRKKREMAERLQNQPETSRQENAGGGNECGTAALGPDIQKSWRVHELSDPYPVKFEVEDRKKRTVLVPNTSHAFCQIMSAALKTQGIRAVPLAVGREEAIRLGCKLFPDMDIGAGTVINGGQCERALAAGAKFIVSPGLSEEVAAVCKRADVPYYPGCVTPTEIVRALELGISTVKFFPASVYGGAKALKALAGPFPQVKFIPTGGVNYENLEDYLSLGNVAAVGGSFLAEGLGR